MKARRKLARVLRVVGRTRAAADSFVARHPSAWRGALARAVRLAPEMPPRVWARVLARFRHPDGLYPLVPDALASLASICVQHAPGRWPRAARRRAGAFLEAFFAEGESRRAARGRGTGRMHSDGAIIP